MSRTSKRGDVLAAQAVWDERCRIMRVREIEWIDTWNSAPDPWTALANWDADHLNRMKVIKPWLAARKALRGLKPKSDNKQGGWE